MRVAWHVLARRDLIEQARYYNTKSLGLGSRFLDEIDRTVADIAEDPFRRRIIERDVRRRITKRFRFLIHYRVAGDVIRILNVRHPARHQDYGMDRE